MKRSTEHTKNIAVSLLVVVFLCGTILQGQTESNVAYNDEENVTYSNPNWMSFIRDNILISELSVPGTHDTMAIYDLGGTGAGKCQSLNLGKQLDAGIRALDIRCRHIDNMFTIHHGPIYLKASFQDVLKTCQSFLERQTSETILMRVQEEHEAEKCTRSFDETFYEEIKDYISFFYNFEGKTNYIPPLGDVRGKIVVLQGFPSDTVYGIPWSQLRIQDEYTVYATESSMNNKAKLITDQIEAANRGNCNDIYINFTSAVGPAGIAPLPMEVAKGISILGIDMIGMNIRTFQYISPRSLPGPNSLFRCGVIMMDFPGVGLIDSIIQVNYKPYADAGGPYVVKIGETVTLDASNSCDKKYVIDRYEWDLDNDGRSDARGITVPFSKPEYGEYTVKLLIGNNRGDFDTDTTTVLCTNIVADAGGPYTACKGQTITLDASNSTDLDHPNDISKYKFEWDLDNDGYYNDAQGVTASFSPTQCGRFTVRLRITGLHKIGIDTVAVTVTDAAPPTPTSIPTSLPHLQPSPTPTPTSMQVPISGADVAVYDSPIHMSIDLTGQTDFDSIDNVGLTIAWNAEKGNATGWDIYVREGMRGPKFLARVNNPDATYIEWKKDAENIAEAFLSGPNFNTAYTFRVIRVDGQITPDDFLDQAGYVGFNIEGGANIPLIQPDQPNLLHRQLVVYDDIMGGNDLAPRIRTGEDIDHSTWRALQIAFGFDDDPASVLDYQILVREEGQNNFSYLGHTNSGNIRYFWWTQDNAFDTAPPYQRGPQDGKTYQFRVVKIGFDGSRDGVNSGWIRYIISDSLH